MEFWVNLLLAVSTALITLATGIIAYKALVFTAKPNIAITVDKSDDVEKYNESRKGVTVTLRLDKKGEEVSLNLSIKNTRIRWIKPSPAASDVRLYINLSKELVPIKVVHSGPSQPSDPIKSSKHDGHYFYIKGFMLLPNEKENEEKVRVVFRTEKDGELWVSVYSNEGDCGTFVFEIRFAAPLCYI